MKNCLFIFTVISVLFLTGCGVNNVEQRDNNVNELTELAFSLNELENPFMEDISEENVEQAIFDMKLQNDKLVGINETYGKVHEGLIDSGDGKKVTCYKLPVTFSFNGNKALMTDFINSLKAATTKVMMSRFDLEGENDAYSLNCVVNFIGSSSKTGYSGRSQSFSMVKSETPVEDDDEIVLRDSEINLTIRPSNSDGAAVTVSSELKNSVYSDENKEINVNTTFYKEGNGYYCKYTVENQVQTDKITVGNDIKFDILSCKKVLDDDAISVNLVIDNQTSKKVSVVVYNDPDERVKVSQSRSVEVSKK